MKAIKNILVPVDFSQNSKAAFEFAVGMAEDMNARVKVLHIINQLSSPSPLADTLIIPASDENYDQKMIEFLSEEENEMGTVLTKRKVEVSSETILGTPNATILNLANSGEYDLLVLGVTGEKSMGEALFGSTASEVSQKSKCPVLLVPKGYRYAGIMDILYACDFDHTSIKQIKAVADVADFFDANVNLVFVEKDESSDDYFENDIKEIKRIFNDYAPKIEFNADVIHEDTVVEGINEYCRDNSVDMVVVITKNRNLWGRFIHASVTKQIAMYAKEPVLIIHED